MRNRRTKSIQLAWCFKSDSGGVPIYKTYMGQELAHLAYTQRVGVGLGFPLVGTTGLVALKYWRSQWGTCIRSERAPTAWRKNLLEYWFQFKHGPYIHLGGL